MPRYLVDSDDGRSRSGRKKSYKRRHSDYGLLDSLTNATGKHDKLG